MKQVGEGELRVILKWLEQVVSVGVRGDVVEMGCYKGETSIMIGEKLVGTGKDLWVYDSFEGLPGGGEFVRGELRASVSDVVSRFRKEGLAEPYVVKGWFSELTEGDMPREICFAFLDGDFYESIADSLRLVAPRMVKGGAIVIHDYRNGKLPGVRRAVEEFARSNGCNVREEEGLGILRFSARGVVS